MFCYCNLVQQIKEIVCQPHILNTFSEWKTRVVPAGCMADIYDGKVWKSFLNFDGQEFFSNKYSLGLALNVDWFKPYKHMEYSVGAMYIAILSYLRKFRYLQKDIL